MRTIYMDHSATTPLDEKVLEEMMPYFRLNYGNPSSIHLVGRNAKNGIEKAREKVANIIGAKKEEIIFTSGGTEADNLAIKGIAFLNKKGHIITSKIEHPAVLNTCKYLESIGFKVKKNEC